MAIATWQGHIPRIHPSAWIHGSAQVIGEVELAEDVSVWPTCVMRGDNGHIKLGARTNFQDGSIAHATLGLSNTTVGIECTIGHRAVLHGCTVGDHCLIGIGATVRIESALGIQVRQLAIARGYMSSSEPVAHFGLGEDTLIKRLSVTWPSGHVQTFTDLGVDRHFTITEPAGPATIPAPARRRPVSSSR